MRASPSLIELHGPVVVAVERVFFSRNAQTAMAVGHARGVVLLAAAAAGVPVREATPNEVKSAVTGYGAADKEQVSRMVQLVLGHGARPTPDDAADALPSRSASPMGWADRSIDATSTGRRPGPGRLGTDRARATPYERAVREALARESERPRPAGPAAREPARSCDRRMRRRDATAHRSAGTFGQSFGRRISRPG